MNPAIENAADEMVHIARIEFDIDLSEGTALAVAERVCYGTETGIEEVWALVSTEIETLDEITLGPGATKVLVDVILDELNR